MPADNLVARQVEGLLQPSGHAAALSSNSWLLRRKITIPRPLVDQVHRAGLVLAGMTRRRVTVLNAPAGFGKTTLLAECCRSLGEDGVRTAWVSLDECDEPALLDNYIALSCRSVGLGIPDRLVPGDAGDGPGIGVTLVARAVEVLDGPFVLALDEVDRPRNPASVALLEFLLDRGPPNLHLAMTCRRLPVGLNVGGVLLQGEAAVVTEKELRFSRAEVAEAFNRNLTQKELAATMADSAGWPVAVRISRDRRRSTSPEYARVLRDCVGNWMESRLFKGLAADERDFLLDVGLFEWMDAELLDEVLEHAGSMRRLRSLPALDGLLARVPGEATDRWQLHPLIREHCIRRRQQEDSTRFNATHRQLAQALMRRGDTVAAMRHAVEAGEEALAGDILEHAGGVQMQLRQGVNQFAVANQLLNENIISKRPRLVLFRCLALALSGRLYEARGRYAAVAATLPDGSGEGNEADFELSVDACVARSGIALHGAERIGSRWVQATLPDLSRLVELKSPRLDPSTRGHLRYRLGIAHHLAGQFDAALHQLALARGNLLDHRYMNIFIDLEIGQIAMAQGRVADAQEHYKRAHEAIQTSDAGYTVPTLAARVLQRELARELNRVAPVMVPAWVPRRLLATPTSFSIYAAASDAAIDQKRRSEGVDGALAAADEMLEYVLGAGLPALVRYLSALRASLLATAARVGDAERDWQRRGLPEDSQGCLDLTEQSWREMEALSCARLRILTARERFDEGRSFAANLCAEAEARGLRRTLMRALSLSMTLEYRAGEPAAVVRHLEAFLRLFDETPYAWPLVREHETDSPVVESLIDSIPHSPSRTRALSLLASELALDKLRAPVLSEREQQILDRIVSQPDKRIATALGLTTHGVRYHLRKLFAKLGVHNRAEAVRRARKLRLIHDDVRADADCRGRSRQGGERIHDPRRRGLVDAR